MFLVEGTLSINTTFFEITLILPIKVEVDRLRTALEHAKQDRDRLRADVDRFRSTIEGIDAELDNLRTSNRNLCQENEKMAAVIDR